jgi:DNA-binding response OmpR family regulator
MKSAYFRPTILVVDDESGIRYYLERFLTREGYQVTTVPDGETALKRLAVEEFDVVLLDLKMRGVGGLEVLSELHQTWPATTVIILTAYASLESAVEALRSGAHDYLFKPCNTDDLRESIRTGLLRRHEQLQLRQRPAKTVEPKAAVSQASSSAVMTSTPERFLQHAGLIIDSIRHVITVDGVLLDLTPTEFNLLAYLVREVPRVVPPIELIREVQGYDSDSREASETIRSHMYHIRQRIQAITDRPVIRTVRGVGYALID